MNSKGTRSAGFHFGVVLNSNDDLAEMLREEVDEQGEPIDRDAVLIVVVNSHSNQFDKTYTVRSSTRRLTGLIFCDWVVPVSIRNIDSIGEVESVPKIAQILEKVRQASQAKSTQS